MKKIKGILASLLIAPALLMSTVSFTKTVEPQTASLKFNNVAPGPKPTGIYIASWKGGAVWNDPSEDIKTPAGVKGQASYYDVPIMDLIINPDLLIKNYAQLHVQVDLVDNTFDSAWSNPGNERPTKWQPQSLKATLVGSGEKHHLIWQNKADLRYGKNTLEIIELWKGNHLSLSWQLGVKYGTDNGNNKANIIKIKNPSLVFNNIA